MNWYYASEGRQIGPITEEELRAQVAAGTIRPDTLVWHEGMANWRPYGETGGGTAEGAAHACSQCGRTFAADELIRFGERYVCAACKPAFVQGLKEGAIAPPVARYGGFWIRVGAYFIDAIILGVISLLFQIPLTLRQRMAGGQLTAEAFGLQMLASGIQMVIAFIYYTFFVGRFAGSPGKLACGLRVVTAEGGRVSYPRALGRHAATLISALLLGIGYLMIAFDDQKRGLHDRICDTRVVRT